MNNYIIIVFLVVFSACSREEKKTDSIETKRGVDSEINEYLAGNGVCPNGHSNFVLIPVYSGTFEEWPKFTGQILPDYIYGGPVRIMDWPDHTIGCIECSQYLDIYASFTLNRIIWRIHEKSNN